MTISAPLTDAMILESFNMPGLNIEASFEPRELELFMIAARSIAAAPPSIVDSVRTDELDAKRYRWLRDIGNETFTALINRDSYITAQWVDKAVDLSILQAAKDKP